MIQNIKPKYPCLKQNQYGSIVLFTAPNTGTKLTNKTKPMPSFMKDNPIGTYIIDGWPELQFVPYNNPVTLQN